MSGVPALSVAAWMSVMLCLTGCDDQKSAVCDDSVEPAKLVTSESVGTRGERRITHVCGHELAIPFVVTSAQARVH